MTAIKTKVWSHTTVNSQTRRRNQYVRASTPMAITSYGDLITQVATVSYHNPGLFLFYRGQRQEHYIPHANNTTSILPSIYRLLPTSVLKHRFHNLRYAAKCVIRVLKNAGVRPLDKLSKYPELAWSIVQHYEICPTPLLDITHSLGVATSFALDHGNAGILYVFGLPIITNGISYSIEEELLNVRLLSCCPPQARRPYYQEGYLLSSFPSEANTSSADLDCAKRLIAKYQLIGGTAFWGKNFRKVSRGALYPDDQDEFRDSLKGQFHSFPYPDEVPAESRRWTT